MASGKVLLKRWMAEHVRIGRKPFKNTVVSFDLFQNTLRDI